MYNLVELFSGIGSQAKALKNLGMEVNTTGTCEWDIHAFIAYDAIHSSPEIPFEILKLNKEQLLDRLKNFTLSNTGKQAMLYESLKTYSADSLRRIYTAIERNKNFVDISSLKGNTLPEKIDIMTYSFPCQDLSNVGAFHGYNKGIDKNSGSRSSLIWQVGRILEEINQSDKDMPRFLLMENVPALLSKRHIGNFNTWINDLKKLGYVSVYYQLNANKFGLPQNRPRLLMISVYVGGEKELYDRVYNYLINKTSDDIAREYREESGCFKHKEIKDLLRIDYNNEKYFKEAVESTPNDTPSRLKIWKENPKLVLEGNIINEKFDVVRTITTKQDRNPNSGNVYFDSGIKGKSKFRYLTPRECMLFMGFTDEDYENIIKNNPEVHKGSRLFSRDKIIKMAGNSIPVKLLEGIFYQILKVEKLLKGEM